MPLLFPFSDDDRAVAFLRPRLWMAALAGALLWVGWLGGLALGDGEFDAVGQLLCADHLAFYSSARLIREGHAEAVYDHQELARYQQSLFPPGKWTSLEAYRNPPFYALLFYPTSGLPYWVSAWIWNMAGLACLWLGIRWLDAPRPLMAAGWALTFLPVFAAISYGQNSLLSFAVMCGTYRLLATGRPFSAGLVAGLLCFKPPLLIGLVVWGLLDVRKLWPAAVGVAVTVAALTLGTYPIAPAAWAGFLGSLQENVQYADFDWCKMHNPRSFWRLLLPFAGPLPTILWLLCVAAGLWGFVRVWREQRDNLPAVFGASVLLTLWASPHTMIYEWSLAVIPAVLWWRLPGPGSVRNGSACQVLLAVGWVALFIGTDFARAQAWFQQHQLGLDFPVVFQASVPMLGWVGWRAVQWLGSTRHAEQGVVLTSRRQHGLKA
jgi:hypothetical protein